jgi:hypothetical protein
MQEVSNRRANRLFDASEAVLAACCHLSTSKIFVMFLSCVPKIEPELQTE